MIYQRCWKLKVIKSRIFTKEEVDFILDNYKGRYNNELTESLNDKFNKSYTVEQIKNFKGNHRLNSELETCFQKGRIPHNKGKKKEEYMSPENVKKTNENWKRNRLLGCIPHEKGTIRKNKNGYLYIKVTNEDGNHKWEGLPRYVYEKHHGPIPKGHKVIHLDGNKANNDIENLMLVSSGELAQINKENYIVKENPELSKSGVLITRINNTVKQKVKKSET